MKLNLSKVNSEKRLKQIEKILTYCKDILNLSVQFVSPKDLGKDSGGYYVPTNAAKGRILVENGHTGLMTIYILLHEIGHHIDFLKRGYNQEEEDAYEKYYPVKRGDKCPLKYKKLIYSIEEYAIKNARELATLLDLKLPAWGYLADELYTIESTKFVLNHGPMTQKERDNLRKRCHKRARKILKCQSNNQKLQVSQIKLSPSSTNLK